MEMGVIRVQNKTFENIFLVKNVKKTENRETPIWNYLIQLGPHSPF